MPSDRFYRTMIDQIRLRMKGAMAHWVVGIYWLSNVGKTLLLLALVVALTVRSRAADNLRLKWDEDLLSLELRDVTANPGSISQVLSEIAHKYLLRVNIYTDFGPLSNSVQCDFKSGVVSGKDLFDQVLAAFPKYTYNSDPETGIVWFYPKAMLYKDILNQKIRIERPLCQVAMSEVYDKLRGLLDVGMLPGLTSETAPAFAYTVDLPAGVYCARDILNLCCTADPTKSFTIITNTEFGMLIMPNNLTYDNPFVSVRPGLIRFWDDAIGSSTNLEPSLEEIRMALSDQIPRKRWAARQYINGFQFLKTGDLVEKSSNSIQAVWSALELKCLQFSVFDDEHQVPYLKQTPRVLQAFTNELLLSDPGLALLISMELARENKDSSVMDIVAKHKFTESEFAVIKPEFYQIVRASALVRKKLRQMRIDLPEMSQTALDELANTNWFILLPNEEK